MEPRRDRSNRRPSRRAFLANFPSTIGVYQQAYQNWAGMIVIDDVWTCAPTSASEVVTLANWAYVNGYRLRARGMCHGRSPILSSVRPRPDETGWDVAVWLDMGTLPVTPGFSAFYAAMESWIWSHYSGSYATVRPEWSKAWARTSAAPWTNSTILGTAIPAAVSAGQASDDGWSTAVSILTGYDPNGVFSNPFLDTLFG